MSEDGSEEVTRASKKREKTHGEGLHGGQVEPGQVVQGLGERQPDHLQQKEALPVMQTGHRGVSGFSFQHSDADALSLLWPSLFIASAEVNVNLSA